jgi:hypothetical protein
VLAAAIAAHPRLGALPPIGVVRTAPVIRSSTGPAVGRERVDGVPEAVAKPP